MAPFPLLTYQDASKRAALIAGAVAAASCRPGKPSLATAISTHERRLTDAQIALIKDWAKAGAPEGDPKAKPEPPKFTDGWQGGQPDQVLTIPVKYSLPADGPDQYRCFVLPTGLDHDVYMDGIEFRPENRRIVHHALVFLDASGQAKEDGRCQPRWKLSVFRRAWIPGRRFDRRMGPRFDAGAAQSVAFATDPQGHGRGDADPLPSFRESRSRINRR